MSDDPQGVALITATPINLGAAPDSIELEGFPLADLGLKRALIRWPDGSLARLQGFSLFEGETLRLAIARTIGRGATLVNDAGEELILPDLTAEEALQISLGRSR